MLESVYIVLVEPSHPGNIGATARAMKTMGLHRLVLVNPSCFPDHEASRRAAGAESVLDGARVVEDIQSAIADCDWVIGTSVRDREVSWPTYTPRQIAEMKINNKGRLEGKTAIVFGRERSGLTNEELELCHAQLRIPANQEYSSLNLASAVQIVAYELHMALASLYEKNSEASFEQSHARSRLATVEELQGHIAHLEETLLRIDFVKTRPPTKLMRKLTRLYNKADLTIEEIQILRGILTAVNTRLDV